VFLLWPVRKVDVTLPGKGSSNSHGVRPVHLIITMIKWIRTSRLSINNSLSRAARGGCLRKNAQHLFLDDRKNLGSRGLGYRAIIKKETRLIPLFEVQTRPKDCEGS